MRSPAALTVIASASLAICLAGCGHSDRLAPEARITLPQAPADAASCFDKPFPEIPDRALTAGDTVRIIGRAKVLDREKTACGKRQSAWIGAVRRDFAKP